MVTTENDITIQRPVDEVFAYFTDMRTEPEWNPIAKRVAKVTDGPIGAGTVFEGEYRRSGHMRFEYETYNPSSSYALRGTARGMAFRYSATFQPVAGGTRIRGRFEAEPSGPMKLLTPVFGAMMRRQMQQSMTGLKRRMESRDTLGRRSSVTPSL